MAVRKTKPTSPGRRFATYQLREELTTDEPNKKLTKGKSKSGGRNAHGRVTSRHRGGGAKRRYRQIDFKRLKDGVPAKVATIEYDPNRTTYIALLQLRRRRQELHPRAAGPRAWRRGRVGRARRHPAWQRAAAALDPDRHHRPQRRDDPRPGRAAGPRRRLRDPGRGEGGADGDASPALLGDAPGPRRLPRHRGHPLQRRAPERHGRQGRAASVTRASARRRAASR